MQIKYVAQKQKSDCVIACLAMLLNIKYEDITANFWQDFNKVSAGLEIEKVIFFLGDCGLNIIRKKAYGFDNLTNSNKELWKPFAQIHLVKVKQWADLKTTHAIIMDSKGKIYDPGDRKATRKSYYEVVEVIGCFLPKSVLKIK